MADSATESVVHSSNVISSISASPLTFFMVWSTPLAIRGMQNGAGRELEMASLLATNIDTDAIGGRGPHVEGGKGEVEPRHGSGVKLISLLVGGSSGGTGSHTARLEHRQSRNRILDGDSHAPFAFRPPAERVAVASNQPYPASTVGQCDDGDVTRLCIAVPSDQIIGLKINIKMEFSGCHSHPFRLPAD